MMRVLILEPDLTGHHAPYLRHIICGLKELRQEIVVATRPGATGSQQFALHLGDVANGVEFDESAAAPATKTYRNAVAQYQSLHRAVERHRPAQVWVPFADGLTEYIAARSIAGRKPPWPDGVEAEGLYFRGRFAYPVERWQKHVTRLITRQLVPYSSWTVLHWLDPLPWEMLRREYPAQAARFRLMPDPVESMPQVDSVTARTKLSIPTDGRYTGCVGVLNDQKNVGTLLAAFRQAGLGDADRLLLAGPMSGSIPTMLERDYGDLVRAGRIVKIDRHLSLDGVTTAVMASDLVCVPTIYRMGSSSFVIRAAAARRPVLADEFGWTGWVIPRFNLGWSTDMRNSTAIAKTWRSAVENLSRWRVSLAAERFVRYHSAENFQAHWTARLRERLGLPSDERLIPWQWVLDGLPHA